MKKTYLTNLALNIIGLGAISLGIAVGADVWDKEEPVYMGGLLLIALIGLVGGGIIFLKVGYDTLKK